MRKTVTLDPDVVQAIEQLRRARNTSFKDVANEALRFGVRHLEVKPKRKRFQTRGFDCGKPLLDNFDNIAEVLEIIEGPFHK